MDTEIEMIRTEQGVNIIDRTKIDNYVHEHFKEKFQTKRQHLNSLPEVSLNDNTPKITENSKLSISHKINQTETNKAVLKLNDDSSPGPDGVTGKFAKYLHSKFPKLFNKIHRHYYENEVTWFNERELKIIQKPGKTNYLQINNQLNLNNSQNIRES